MSTAFPVTPLRYLPTCEHQEDGEVQTAQELAATLEKISRITSADYGHAVRSVHAKGQGLLKGVLDVKAGLPPELAQGLFATPRSYAAIARLSTSPGDILDDHISTPRGMAIKVTGVEGPRLDSDDHDRTQDFLLVNGPTFLAPDARHFLKSLKLLAATTDKAEGLKRALSTAFRGAEKIIEAVGGDSATLKSLGGHPLTHVLGETFFTQTPLLFGDYMAKLRTVPATAALQALTGAPVDLHDRPDGLREEVARFFAANDGEWDVQVQLCTSLEQMPIEDASVAWPQDASPYLSVATLRVPRQDAWLGAASVAAEDALAFSPWHCIAAHRPLGSINRVRRVAYEASSSFRAAFNRCPIHEPRG